MALQRLKYLEILQLWFKTLFYNSCFSWSYAVDTCLEPLFYLVDHTTKYIGRIFVASACVLVGIVVIIAHLVGIPIYWKLSPSLTLGFLLPFGYWILINLMFNFIQGVRTSPGLPYNPTLLTYSVTICKKCISPKPPRTHHCSICNRCYLKMDHHCPWLNNCVGHFNHRYFYLTMIYFVIGCVFIIIFGVHIAYYQVLRSVDLITFEYDTFRNESLVTDPLENSSPYLNSILSLQAYFANHADADISREIGSEGWGYLLFGIPVSKSVVITMICVVGILVGGACIALAPLSIWHGKLISLGETSIEYHINKNQKKKNKDFLNPYDRGSLINWQIFLGLDKPGRSFARHILLPSSHPPNGNGYEWSHLDDSS